MNVETKTIKTTDEKSLWSYDIQIIYKNTASFQNNNNIASCYMLFGLIIDSNWQSAI